MNASKAASEIVLLDCRYLADTWKLQHREHSPQTLILALDKAGKDLTVDSFVVGVESIKDYKDIFGSLPMSFAADKHQGSNESVLAQVEKGKWKLVGNVPLGY
jgi:hypothetical protein